MPRIHKPGQETHTFQRKRFKNSAAPIIIIDALIGARLRRYGRVWSNCFRGALKLDISGDCVENVLWRAWDISLPHTTSFVITHCGTNNVDQNQPKDIAVRIMKIVQTFTKEHPKINTIKETFKNKYHHYWRVTKVQDVLFSANKNS